VTVARVIAAILVVVIVGGLPDRLGAPSASDAFPRPALTIARMPPLPATAITAGGQRLLLNQADVHVQYDASTNSLSVDRPGWWVINYPLTKIAGLNGRSADDISRQLFGVEAARVRNWYVRSAGRALSEPAAPTGPAPIDVAPNPTIVVNNQSPAADDRNAGTAARPLQTISAAVQRAAPGAVIQVWPGVYRETVTIGANGTAERPIRLEGLRAPDGRMPVISGNDLFRRRAWTPVAGLGGVYRADLFSGVEGTVSAEGRTLIERNHPAELGPDEFALNRASYEFLEFRVGASSDPVEGEERDGRRWRRIVTDADGFLQLESAYGPEAQNAVFWASTFVWVDLPGAGSATTTDSVDTAGEFRAARMSGASLVAQSNKYRVWVNGALLPALIHSTDADPQFDRPRSSRRYGSSDSWDNFPLRQGWNHIVLQFDTTTHPEKTAFRFNAPQHAASIVSAAATPAGQPSPDRARSRPYVAEYLVLGPFAARPDVGVYLRLPGDADPNAVAVDLAARGGTLVRLNGDFLQVRGFEVRDGAQFQQQSQIEVNGQGDLVEGCLVRDSEMGGIGFVADKDLTASPIVVRNNWIVNPGDVGISGSGRSDLLTAENLNDPAPGRSRILVEYNTVINNDWAGFSIGWEAGAVKVLKMTGAVIRYNTIVGGAGPGIWLDWENYANRIDGNLFVHGFGYGVGVEASPGPNLISNNLSIDLRSGPDWFRAAVLGWDSEHTWAVNNTIDGRGSVAETLAAPRETFGIDITGTPVDRGTLWGRIDADPANVYVNNLVVGCPRATVAGTTDIVGANYSDRGLGASILRGPPGFLNADAHDYRLQPDSPLNQLGTTDAFTPFVAHDFFGLLRFPAEAASVGAFRADRVPTDGAPFLIELELEDGTLRRIDRLAAAGLAPNRSPR
jgi:parallel beta helix pectate lyase-like protein